MSLQEKILNRKLKKKEKQKLKIIEERKKAQDEPTGILLVRDTAEFLRLSWESLVLKKAGQLNLIGCHQKSHILESPVEKSYPGKSCRKVLSLRK